MYYLEQIKVFLNELKQSNSGNYKKEILFNYKDEISDQINPLNYLLHYVYDYDKQYYVTSSNILKHFNDKYEQEKYEVKYTLWGLLELLSSRSITGYDAIYSCVEFIKSQAEYKEIILDIIDKDLKIGLSETTINKVVPNLIKTFKVALAKNLEKEQLDESYVCSRKLDGCRCIAICKNKNDIKFFSRQGKEFDTLSVLKQDIIKLFDLKMIHENCVLDGEICIEDEDGKEDFQAIMKEIKRKNHTIKNPMYILFDYLSLDEFNNGTSKHGYRDRIRYLQAIEDLKQLNFNTKINHIRVVEYFDYEVTTFEAWQQRVIDLNWEGLIARKDVPYEAKRSSNMLKIKKFNDAEYEVVGIEKGIVQDVENGVVQKIEAVGSLIIEHKGNKVGVGSGLSLEQRKRWLKHPEEIIGKTVTVKYFEETIDQNGNPSLRFPVLKYVYEKKRDL